MGLVGRLGNVARSVTRVLLTPAEDPRTSAASIYERQDAFLEQVRLAKAVVSQARERLQASAGRLTYGLVRFQEQATASLEAGREDIARDILHRREVALVELAALKQRILEVEEEERNLALSEHQLAVRLESLRATQEVVQAQSEAETRIGLALGQVSREGSELDLAFERARASMQRVLADSTAFDRLAGLLEATGGDSFNAAVRQIDAAENAESMLAILKQQLAERESNGAH